MTPRKELFDRETSCLLVIDVQQYFLDKLPIDHRQPLVARIAWLMRVTGRRRLTTTVGLRACDRPEP